MNALRSVVLSLLAVQAGGSAHAASEHMVFLAPTNTAMPMGQFTDGKLSGGILLDLGKAIADQLGRKARFVSMPSKRVGMALRNNEADALCYVLPQWIDGQFHWSRPLLPNAAILVALPDAPPIRSLQDLAGTKIGTVSGYRYPELDALLGKDFLRDDAPTTEHGFSKLAAGRTRYAIVGRAMLAYRQRTDKHFRIRVDHVFATITAQCALAAGSRVLPAQFDKAINTLIETGAVEHILSSYR
ncbi:MAG: transporter substrate-binding domain-containing protein [Pseudomonadota bacterium]